MGGGKSNPTFFVDFEGGGSRVEKGLVLRKQPAGDLLPSAHAIDREFRMLRALASTEVPVPVARAFCEDRTVIGTPFYLMDKLEGRVMPDYALPAIPREERR